MTAARPLDARQRILAAAVDLFARQGFDGTSVAQVITAAGVAKGGFYHHFASKEALLYEVYGDLITRQLASLDAILAAKRPAAETLRAVILDLVESTAASAQQALVFHREMNRLDDEGSAEARRQRRRYHDAVLRLVRRGQAAGDFAPTASPEIVTFTIFGLVNELPLWYRPSGRKKAAQIGAEFADLVLRSLST
ncbi:MAG: TetR/AcrR family transcriptional regulator [Jatrophihabitans sp.]|uniref:TetR/AcrR family transcriptional regulator n=1 Tax=Jatrophihabitans sp. TaxID=1932789 RepID=UPI003F8230EA